jgi:hypothetical protein
VEVGIAGRRWPGLLGRLGVVAGLLFSWPRWFYRGNDPALVVALILGMRGSRLILEVDS